MDQFLAIHRLFRALQEKYRYVRKASKLDLGRIEVHLLLELDANPELTISELAKVLSVDPSVVSRSIQLLASNDFLEIAQAEHDSRQKVLQLTKLGQRKLVEIDRMAGEALDAFASNLTSKEQQHLADFFKIIADGFGQLPTSERKGEKAFRREHRRVTRALGYLKKDVFHSGLSSSDWATLSEICRREVAPSASDLAQLLSLATNSMTPIVDKLEREGYITRAPDLENHRRRLLLPTERGRSLFKSLEHKAARDLKLILKHQSTKKISEFLDLLARFVDTWMLDSEALPQHFTVRQLKSTSEIKKARTFIIRELVLHNLEEFIPETFFSKDLEVWALFDSTGGSTDAKLCAACQSLATNHSWRVEVIAWSTAVSRRTALAFIRNCYLTSTKEQSPSELIINFSPYSKGQDQSIFN